MREKGVMEYGKTEAAVEENVSLPSGSTRRGEIGRWEEGRGVSGWRSRRIERKVSKRGGNEEERERDTYTRREKEAEPAKRLGRFIPDQLHFQPSSEYKRQFNYRGIFKGESRVPSLVSLSLFLRLFFFPLSIFRRLCVLLHSICRRQESLRSATQENSLHAHRYIPSCLRIPTWTSLDDIS